MSPPNEAMHAASAFEDVSLCSLREMCVREGAYRVYKLYQWTRNKTYTSLTLSPSVPHSPIPSPSPFTYSNKHPPNNTNALDILFTVPVDAITPEPNDIDTQ